VERPFVSQSGEREVDFIDIVVWRKLAETVANHLNKGRLVAVDGRLQVRSYETQEGQKRRVAEVVADNVRFLDWPKENQTSGNFSSAMGFDGFGSEVSFSDDDIPF
jgi:single-strand DNA-binding protein